MSAWIRSLFSSSNIICVRDPLDDGKEDSAYPTEFAAMMGRIRQEKPDSRKQFESWIANRLGTKGLWTMRVTQQQKDECDVLGKQCNAVGEYLSPAVQLAWDAWQASRLAMNTEGG